MRNKFDKGDKILKIGYLKKQYKYETETEIDIDVYFKYRNTIVWNENKELIILSKYELREHEGAFEINRHCRGDNLIAQGIISFFSGLPLTMDDEIGSISSKEIEIIYKKQEIHLKIQNIDYTEDLKILLQKLNEELKSEELIITLLDRWRKAIYLMNNRETDIYYDEVILTFFHILEIFGNNINEEFKKKLQNDISSMLENHFKLYYLTETELKNKITQNKKTFEKLLIGDYLTLSMKIKYFLEKYDLLNDNIAFFIEEIIKIRNLIAHGTIEISKKVMWPLPMFYNLSKYSHEKIDILFYLTARMISAYIGINLWKNEWEDCQILLMPSKYNVSKFLNGDIGITDFNTNNYNITWRTLFYYYVNNPKEKIREKIEKVTKFKFIESTINKENYEAIFKISTIFADSEDEYIKKKARENVKKIIENSNEFFWNQKKYLEHFRIPEKDIYNYLEYYSVNVKWYKKFIENREYLNLEKQN